AWLSYLRRLFSIAGDPTKDWQRLYRLPHATRDGRAPESLETLGDPYAIGLWEPNLVEEDWATASAAQKGKRPGKQRPDTNGKRPDSKNGRGLLYYLLEARGILGEEIEPGKWAVKCPLESEHSRGEAYDTSTVLFAPSP